MDGMQRTGSVVCLLLGVGSDCAQPITGQVTEVTSPVIGRTQPVRNEQFFAFHRSNDCLLSHLFSTPVAHFTYMM